MCSTLLVQPEVLGHTGPQELANCSRDNLWTSELLHSRRSRSKRRSSYRSRR